MVKFTIEKVRALMDVPENIRNVTVIAHVDHGKSTLTDSLILAAGITGSSEIGKRITDTRPDEQLRGVTIKSTGITLYFEGQNAKGEKKENLINLIDSPGHVDFSSEVTAALRLTDGALVLVDCVEGCCVQTDTVLRQALRERVKPVLAVNKLDRFFLELQLDAEEIYQHFCRAIESVNAIIATHPDEELGDLTVYPEKGTVAFTAGKQGWGFTLKQFANFYAKKFGINENKLVEKLWGDHYYDPEAKVWTSSNVSATGQPLPRAFCKYIIQPISQVFEACLTSNMEQLEKLTKVINVNLSADEKQLPGKDLLKVVMQRWLPAADALLEMITTHLPSPAAAQKYRTSVLYSGPLDDPTAESIRKCDPNGPLVVFVSKMVPTKDNSRFFAFGRVFSGTVSPGQKVRVLGPNYVHGKKEDLFTDVSVQRTVVMMGKKTESVTNVPCGNTVALVGIDNYLAKSGTLTTDPSSYPLANMKYSVSPVVRVAVSPKDPANLLKLVEALKRLSKSDQLVQCTIEPTGEHIVACAGELHLEICINDLKEFMNGAELIISEPVVTFQETVLAKSSVNCLAKSPNGHNRLWCQAEPLDEGLVDAIEKTSLVKEEAKARARTLVNNFGWNLADARSIWAFGPTDLDANVLVDSTKGVQYMNEVKDSVVSAFRWVAREGVLAEENLRGVRFNITDATLHADAIHRGAGQLIPSAKRVFCASQLTAKPSLLEPIFLVEIQCPYTAVSGIYSTLSQRRGVINETLQKSGGSCLVKAYLPVVESFGFTEHLREQTSGQAFPQCVFDHWQVISGDPMEPNSKAADLLLSIRKRKGLPVGLPNIAKYLDKL